MLLAIGLHWADLTVVLAYLAGVTVLGIWSARRVHSMSDYFMPRRFGKAFLMMHSFGTGTHSDQAVGVASKTFTNGLSGIWYSWLSMFTSPFYWLIAPMLRRTRAVTTGDVLDLRFDRSVAILFAVVGIYFMSTAMGIMLVGSRAIINACTDIPGDWAVLIMSALFVAYGVAGGLGAAIITDFIQGILTILFSFLLLPPLLSHVGGIDGITAFARAHENPGMVSLVAPEDITIFFVVMLALNALVGIIAQPHTMGNCSAGKTESDGRVGFAVGFMFKRVCTVAWCLTGLAAVVLFTGKGLKPGEIYGTVAKTYPPGMLPGLLGLFLAALLASIMSSGDSFMVASAALFTENIYKPMRPGRPDRHYLQVGRIVGIVVVAGGLAFAYYFGENVIKAVEFMWGIVPMVGVPLWLGIFWRRTTPAGAWAGALFGFALVWLTSQEWFATWLAGLPAAESLGLVVSKASVTSALVNGQAVGAQVTGSVAMYEPWKMLAYMGGDLVAVVAVSLLTPRVAEEKLDRFYALLRTPVTPGEQVEASCTLPKGVIVPPPRKLLPLKDWEIPVPSASAVIGFLSISAAVAALIGFVYWMMS